MSRTTKTNWSKWKNLGALGALGFIMLFQYQNCAPAPGGATSADVSRPVDVIDQVGSTSALRFTYSKVQVTNTSDSAVLDGECDRIAEGTIVGWDVQDDSGSSSSGGSVKCDRGRFKVELAPNQELECGKTYEVSARTSDGTEGRTEVEMVCN